MNAGILYGALFSAGAILMSRSVGEGFPVVGLTD